MMDAAANEIQKLNERIAQLEQENDAMRADLLLWNEKEVKP
jgi:outer membrane murein-binding lipoprotein Lpp